MRDEGRWARDCTNYMVREISASLGKFSTDYDVEAVVAHFRSRGYSSRDEIPNSIFMPVLNANFIRRRGEEEVMDEADLAQGFGLGPLLTVTTGVMLCEVGELYEILNFMTSDKLFTHQLPRAGEACKPEVLRQHPNLPTEGPNHLTTEGEVRLWLAETAALLEPHLEWPWKLKVKPLGRWESKNPVVELHEMRPGMPIISVAL